MGARRPPVVTRWTSLVVALVVLAVAGLGAIWLTYVPAEVIDARLVGLTEPAWVQRAGARVMASDGFQLSEQDLLELPSGAGGTVQLGGTARIEIEPGSVVRFGSLRAEIVEVEIDDGTLRASADKDSPPLRIRRGGRTIDLVDATVRVAASEDTLAVDVERGEATFTGFDDVTSARAGERVTATPSGTSRMAVPESVVLDVSWPTSLRTRVERLRVAGRTNPGSRVVLKGDQGPDAEVVADELGSFQAEVTLREGLQEVLVEARDPFGKIGVERISIERDTRPPIIRGGREGPR
jgi:hypothetical protein